MLSELTVLRDLSCYYSKLLEDTVSVWAELNLM